MMKGPKTRTTAQVDRDRRSEVRPHLGLNPHHWALFVNGLPVHEGLSREEADSLRELYVEEGRL
jgi:hypothetical protein